MSAVAVAELFAGQLCILKRHVLVIFIYFFFKETSIFQMTKTSNVMI
uniref:Uncharacterized protein n=1 Tax=Anguilla anguilla TaxID=7936 RepID=A0A0E9U623_ANGAN